MQELLPYHSKSIYLAGFDPLGWLQDVSWYREMLQAEWFQPILPFWTGYRLDLWIAGLLLIALVLTIRWLVRRRRRRMSLPAMSRNPLKIARRLKKQGEYRLAAEAYLLAGKRKQAYELYKKDGCLIGAAQVAEQLGRVKDAVELYEAANDPMGAIRVLRQSKDLDRAAEIFRRLDKMTDAAQMYLEASELGKAAELFREIKLFGKAASVYLEEGDEIAAAECLLDMVNSSNSGFTQDEMEQLSQGALILLKKGRLAESAHLSHSAGDLEQAAERFLLAGQKELAAQCYQEAGLYRNAASLFRELGDTAKWIDALEHLEETGDVDKTEYVAALLESGFTERAAELYRNWGDLDTAVETLLQGQRFELAAEWLAESGKHGQAGELYMQAGDALSAREQFVISKDPEAAASAALAGGLFFEAGEEFFSLGEYQRAIEALQRVSVKHPSYQTTCSLLGQAFSRMNDLVMALRMLRRSVAGLTINRDNLELYYQLAVFLENSSKDSDREEARQIFSEILELDYNFRDVQRRNKSIESSDHCGTRFGKYQLLERIGQGGMAEVYKAKIAGAAGFEKIVALKRIYQHLAENEEFVNMFVNEAKIAGQLNHPNIAQVYDLGVTDDQYFIAMEYVHGVDLRSIWSWQKEQDLQLPLPASIYLVVKVCEGLEYAHQKILGERHMSIVHRDISPQNILISFRGEIKIIDFGIAQMTSVVAKSKQGTLKGKFGYMSPEQANGQAVDHRSDIFSTGIVLYELCTGENLFQVENDLATLHNVQKADIPAPTVYNPEISKELEQLILTALAKDPASRFHSAGEMGKALERFARNQHFGFEREDLAEYMNRNFKSKHRLEVNIKKKKGDKHSKEKPVVLLTKK